ncbi:snurportin-1 [Anoplophora glabripennis]|uniref:snurportin-1 n=1 Tax=Anoplophora glabripennis TaxID=217634 RepID=UPI00087372FE|nr:snurportin-1 [Anoplophora glabripennis]
MGESVEQSMEAWSFTSLYKYKGKNVELSQQQRREKFLEDQKQKRHEVTDSNRNLCEDFLSELHLQEEQMECDELEQPRKKIKYKLMQSEWFTDIPDDLEENWLAKLCPQGFRVLFIAQNNKTIVSTEGRIILNIQSNFPGGGGIESRGGITILDCIFNRSTKTIFVLDCLFWNSMSMLDSEASFRFFWLKTKFNESPSLLNYKKYNFSLLEVLPAHRSLIQDKMFTLLSVGEQKYPYDGVVFYHKESNYTFGYTPLVAWLASYMLPEKLHIDVSPENMFRRPKDYVCMETYLENLSKRKKLRYNSKQHKTNSQMETQ